MAFNAAIIIGQIFNAVKNSDIHALVDILKKNPDLNIDQTDGDECTPLLYSIIYNDIDISKLLIEKGADINLAQINKINIMYLITNFGPLKMLKYLLEVYPDCNKLDSNAGQTLLHYLVSSNELSDEEVIERIDLLLSHGADINAINSSYFMSPLSLAIQTKRLNVIDHLISVGADVNVKGQFKPIFSALIPYPDIEICKYLINHGANVNAIINQIYAPLVVCIYNAADEESRYKMIELMLDAGANINHEMYNGVTALHIALDKRDINVFNLLLKKSVPIFYLDSLLELALQMDFYEGIKSMIKLDLNANEIELDNVLSVAVEFNCKNEILQLLIDDGADFKSSLVIRKAVLTGNLRIMKLFAAYGAEIETGEKYLLIIEAIKYLYLDVLKYLLEIDVLCLNYAFEGITLLQYAFDVYKSFDQDDIDAMEPAKILMKYIAIHLAMGLHISKNDIKSIQSMQWADDYYKICQKEISLMKTMKINEDKSTRTYFHLLIQNSTLVNCLRNHKVSDTLKTFDYKKAFAIYGDILNNNYLWGVDRLKKLNKFEAIVDEVLGILIPVNIASMICEYLKNKDFKEK